METVAYAGAIIGILGGVMGSAFGILGARAARTGDASQLLAVTRVASVVCLLLAVGGGVTRLAVPVEPLNQLAEILWFVGASALSVMAFVSFSHSGGGRTHTTYLTVALASGVLLTALGVHSFSTGGDWGRSLRELIWGTILLFNSSLFLFLVKRNLVGNRVK